MKLTLDGIELPTDKEIDLRDEKFGYRVTIVEKIDSASSIYEKKQVKYVRNNCTQVHYLYPTFPFKNQRVAFESDIHNTGGTRDLNDIDSITIETETQLSYCHWNDKTEDDE